MFGILFSVNVVLTLNYKVLRLCGLKFVLNRETFLLVDSTDHLIAILVILNLSMKVLTEHIILI